MIWHPYFLSSHQRWEFFCSVMLVIVTLLSCFISLISFSQRALIWNFRFQLLESLEYWFWVFSPSIVLKDYIHIVMVLLDTIVMVSKVLQSFHSLHSMISFSIRLRMTRAAGNMLKLVHMWILQKLLWVLRSIIENYDLRNSVSGKNGMMTSLAVVQLTLEISVKWE